MAQGQVDFGEVFGRMAASGAREEAVELGGMRIRLVRVAGGGTGTWDSHAHTAETALCWSGDFTVTFRDGTVALGPGGCCVVPAGAEHHGTSKGGAEVVLFTATAGA